MTELCPTHGPVRPVCPVCGQQIITMPAGGFFNTLQEAHDWLPPDADSREREQASWDTPDQYHEWQQWTRTDSPVRPTR